LIAATGCCGEDGGERSYRVLEVQRCRSELTHEEAGMNDTDVLDLPTPS
jgi:hypothetical protein